MRSVLDIVGRPIAFSRSGVSLIEQRIESLKDKRFIFRFNRLIHFVLLTRATPVPTYRTLLGWFGAKLAQAQDVDELHWCGPSDTFGAAAVGLAKSRLPYREARSESA